MDITQDPKRLRKESEPGSERSSPASIAPNRAIELDGKSFELPPDWDQLEEIDYENLEVARRIADQEAESISLYGKMTAEEVSYLEARIPELQRLFPEKPIKELNAHALRGVRETKG
jgi:hypothetical protein